MKNFRLPLLFAALLTASCGPAIRVHYSANRAPLPEGTDVVVLNLDENSPESGMYVAEIAIGNGGFSMDCDYSTVIGRAKREALKQGGNLVKITRHRKPDFFSSCHRIEADVYLVAEDDLDLPPREDATDEALLAEDCAMLYFYRVRNPAGSLINYNVRIGDDVVWRAANNRKEWVKVKAIGRAEITAKTESERRLEIDIQPGRHYYIRCGVDMGLMVGRPSLELVDGRTGKYEFDEIQN